MSPRYITAANLFRTKRQSLNLTQGQIAARGNCSIETISKLERGVANFISKIEQNRDSASKILKVYKITPEELKEALFEDEKRKVHAKLALVDSL